MSEKMYHISLEVDRIIDVFKPTLYPMVYQNENGTIPHISVSSSISGCLSGVPWGGRKLENVSTGIFDMTEHEIKVVFRIYEFDKKDIEEVNFIATEQLLENGLVMDAHNADECWVINQGLTPSKTYIGVLMNYYEENTDVYAHEFYLIDEPTDLDDFIIGYATKIAHIELETYETKEAIPYAINWDEWYDFLEKLGEENYELY